MSHLAPGVTWWTLGLIVNIDTQWGLQDCSTDWLQIGNSRQRDTINSHILILTSIKTLGILNRQIIQFSKQLLANQTYFFIPRGSLFVKVTLQSHKATVSKFMIMFYCELCSHTILPSPYIYLLYKSSDNQRLLNYTGETILQETPLISKHYSWSEFLFEVNDHVQCLVTSQNNYWPNIKINELTFWPEPDKYHWLIPGNNVAPLTRSWQHKHRFHSLLPCRHQQFSPELSDNISA